MTLKKSGQVQNAMVFYRPEQKSDLVPVRKVTFIPKGKQEFQHLGMPVIRFSGFILGR